MRYNKITPAIAEELRAVVGPHRFFDKEAVDPNYGHDEMPIYGKYMPEAAVDVETTEEVSAVMKICNDNLIPVTPRGAGTGLVGASVAVLGGGNGSLEGLVLVIANLGDDGGEVGTGFGLVDKIVINVENLSTFGETLTHIVVFNTVNRHC